MRITRAISSETKQNSVEVRPIPYLGSLPDCGTLRTSVGALQLHLLHPFPINDMLFSATFLLLGFLLLSQCPSISLPPNSGLTFDRCRPSSFCLPPRRCRTDDDSRCTSDESFCFCLPPFDRRCIVSSECPGLERCFQSPNSLDTICGSPNTPFNYLDYTLAPPVSPSLGLLFDDCSRSGFPGTCGRGLFCVNADDLETPCDSFARCVCVRDDPLPCLVSSDCPNGFVCVLNPVWSIPVCASRDIAERRIALRPVALRKTSGLTMEPCSFNSQCQGARRCLEFSRRPRRQPCRPGGAPCACLSPKPPRCRSTSQCADKREVCARVNDIGIKLPICVSLAAAKEYDHIEQTEAQDDCPLLFFQDFPGARAGGRAVRMTRVVRFENSTRQFAYRRSRIPSGSYVDAYGGMKSSITDKLIVGMDNNTLLLTSRRVKIPNLRPTVAIVGGRPASSRLRKFMALIDTGEGTCSGVVVGMRWVMTAAHCNVQRGAKVFIASRRDVDTGRALRVKRSVTHPQYCGPVTEEFDVAMLELTTNVPAGTPFMKVNRFNRFPQVNAPVRALGYGEFAEERFDGILRQVDMRVVNTLTCAILFGTQAPPVERLDLRVFICAAVQREQCGIW